MEDLRTDSELTMVAEKSFSDLLYAIQNSGLNFQLQLSPYSAYISLKKSLQKDKSGSPIIPSEASSFHQKVEFELKKTNEELHSARSKINELESALLVKQESKIVNNEIMVLRAEIDILRKENVKIFQKIDSLDNTVHYHHLSKDEINVEVKEVKTVAQRNVAKIDDHTDLKYASSTSSNSVTCGICAADILNYIPVYFCGEAIDPACNQCKTDANLVDCDMTLDPFDSFYESEMPNSMVTHWTPTNITSNRKDSPLNLPSLQAHYVCLSNPGNPPGFLDNSLNEVLLQMKLLMDKMDKWQSSW